MTVKVINYEEAKRLLQAQVDKKGARFAYRGDPYTGECYNWRLVDGRRVPDCIVGHVIHDLGLLDLVGQVDGSDPALGDLARKGVVATDKARALFYRVQVRQDAGHPWQRALELGVEEIEDSPLAYLANLRDEVAA